MTGGWNQSTPGGTTLTLAQVRGSSVGSVCQT
jgi:hypothetical protein